MTYKEQTRIQIRERDRLEQLFEELEQLVATHGPQDVLHELHYVFQNAGHGVNGCPEQSNWIMIANATKALAASEAARGIDGLTPEERHAIENAPTNDEN